MGKSRIKGILLLGLGMAVYLLTGSYGILCIAMAVLVILLAGACYTGFSGKKIEVQLQFPENGEKGIVTEGTFVVQNDSVFPLLYGIWYLNWENRLTGEKGEQQIALAVPGKKSEKRTLRMDAKYSGAYEFSIKRMEIRDAFSLFRKKRETNLEAEVIVLPEITRIETTALREEAYDMESFQYSDRQRGEDTGEVFQLRSYQPGDSMKQVHWKLSAKLDELTVKEASYPVYDAILVFMETGFEEKMPKADLLDRQMSRVLSAVKSLLDEQVTCELAFYDYQTEKVCRDKIESQEEFWQVAMFAIRAGRKAGEGSGLRHFLEQSRDHRYAHYIYVTASEEPKELDWLRREAKVTVLN